MSGKPGPKRNRIERARDMRLIAPMYLFDKLSQGEIAERLNTRPGITYTLSQKTISNDLAALRKAWLAAGIMDLNKAKAQELGRIDALEATYWQAWLDSCEVGVKVSKEKKLGGVVVSTRQEIDSPSGDPRHLAGVQWCVERRAKLLGLDELVEPTNSANLVSAFMGAIDRAYAEPKAAEPTQAEE